MRSNEFHACKTGDCEHKTQSECDLELANYYDSMIPDIRDPFAIEDAVNFLKKVIHKDTKAWWKDLDTEESVLNYPKKHLNTWIGTKLMLVCSEIGEAMEGLRKDQMDDKLPHRKMIEVELADAIIRILDLSEGLGLDVGGAMAEKLEFNRNREDFKVENRKKDGGKTI